jgi:hypothetical protein
MPCAICVSHIHIFDLEEGINYHDALFTDKETEVQRGPEN